MYSWHTVKALTEDQVDSRVEEWHTMDDEVWESIGQPDLHEWLGWTEQEYNAWVVWNQLPKE